MEAPDEAFLCSWVSLTGNMLRLLVYKAHRMQQGVHAADGVNDAKKQPSVLNDRPGRGVKVVVKQLGELLALFIGKSGYPASVPVAKEVVFLTVAEALDPVSNGLLVEEHDLGDFGNGATLVEEEDGMGAAMFDGGTVRTVQDAAKRGSLLFGKKAGQSLHALIVLLYLNLINLIQLLPKYFL